MALTPLLTALALSATVVKADDGDTVKIRQAGHVRTIDLKRRRRARPGECGGARRRPRSNGFCPRTPASESRAATSAAPASASTRPSSAPAAPAPPRAPAGRLTAAEAAAKQTGPRPVERLRGAATAAAVTAASAAHDRRHGRRGQAARSDRTPRCGPAELGEAVAVGPRRRRSVSRHRFSPPAVIGAPTGGHVFAPVVAVGSPSALSTRSLEAVTPSSNAHSRPASAPFSARRPVPERSEDSSPARSHRSWRVRVLAVLADVSQAPKDELAAERPARRPD
jgi:hypothetical protein